MEQPRDLSSDIDMSRPSAARVHEVAQAANPASRVVYVDIDPVAVMHSRSILERDISHSTYEAQPQEMLDAQKLSKRTATEITLRSHAEISSYFGDFALVDPGLVHLPLWRPESLGDVDEHPERFGAFGGVGRAG